MKTPPPEVVAELKRAMLRLGMTPPQAHEALEIVLHGSNMDVCSILMLLVGIDYKLNALAELVLKLVPKEKAQ